MKASGRYLVFVAYVSGSLFFIFLAYLLFQSFFSELFQNVLSAIIFISTIILYIGTVQEVFHWAKMGRRSEMSDIVAILFFLLLILLITNDFMTAMFGAFAIYLWFGVFELKEYPVINKILVISLVTYNTIFIAGLISFYLGDPFALNTTFAFSFWIILGLGFLLFGRKYIIVWRFMSPAYLTLFIYIIAWLAVVFVNEYTPLEFNQNTPLQIENLQITDVIFNIYFVLIVVNWGVYFISGPILDKMLGIKNVDDNEKLKSLIEEVKKNIGIKSKVKVGFGEYPILNAMAYGSFLDKRIAIIAENINQIPEDELKGIVAHELAHTKGYHTLILTFISTGDLVIRMLLGLPATYYDYTFGDPQIPMIGFIFLNLGIYLFLFILIRILESKADLMSKKAGYAKELAKALYNLESFYATGREIGLNTMLLCDEKITKENQIIDYMDTAQYLHESMISPSRGSLLGNMMNSHPPSYHRIAAILSDNELKPGREALLPFICLKRSKQRKYAKKFEKARLEFKKIATEKFKEFFNVENVSTKLEEIGRREIFRNELGKDFIFKNKITQKLILGKLEDVQFLDDICDSDQYLINDYKINQLIPLNTSLYSRIRISLKGAYFLQKDLPLTLTDIEFEGEKEGFFLFSDPDQTSIKLPMKKTKLPNSMEIIKSYVNQDVFLKEKAKLKIFKCVDVITAENYDDYQLEFVYPIDGKERRISYKLGELIIRPKNIYIIIHRSLIFRKSELKIIDWLIKKQVRSSVYLKKPVNNLEVGYIQKSNFNLEENENNMEHHEDNNQNFITLRNIFGKEITIPYKKIEMITFEHTTAMIYLKSKTTTSSKLGYKLLKKFKPEKIFYLN